MRKNGKFYGVLEWGTLREFCPRFSHSGDDYTYFRENYTTKNFQFSRLSRAKTQRAKFDILQKYLKHQTNFNNFPYFGK